ncbi:flavin reductase family protein [Bosea sp. (in: a-proteobacteria)]|uniref:flavin reductase family protein n=1 Tax=Bosea sp. (in: a-proteobacteria) TaxID=1871050 RepID=UPI002735E13D|nr:flavin reductase family protein [Bosea sp. (in: a-proteobacteria)]MDP3258813.1 flavin reductase family protein [Bosea sp. (in: a-proteobacteria)]
MSAFTVAFSELAPRDRYKLLCASVTPRPIALVTSLSPDGVVNAAPFSFFNVFSEDPALIVLGLQHRLGNNPKDTTRNIAGAGEFVVNLVDEGMAEAMNICAVDFPPEISEIDAAGLTLKPGISVGVPHIAQAPFALECRKTMSLVFSPTREMLIGEVVRIHAREGLVDPATLRVSLDDYKPVGRMFGDGYARQNDRFDLTRGTYAEWLAQRGS